MLVILRDWRFASTGGPLFGAANLRGELNAEAIGAETADQAAPVWIQIARTGMWMGHPDHPKGVEFSRATFEQVIANFHRHPAFKLGGSGKGESKVVPFDYEHASEMHPTSGSIPRSGAPAPAWAVDVEMREGADGTAELWALTQLGDQAREQIQNEEYQWTSVSIWPAARDRVTNKPIGAVLTSVAFTNHPFIQGMTPMRASDRAFRASVSVWGQAESIDEFVIGLRDIFGLPAEADVAAVSAEVDALEQLVEAGAVVPGVELNVLVDDMRRLLGLRRLAPRSELFEAARATLAAGAIQKPGEATPPPTPESSDMKLSATLAQILKCRDTDEAILAAAKEVAEKTEKQGTAIDQLLSLFNSTELDGLVAEATKSVAAAAQVGPLLESLKSFRETLGKNADAEAEVEADAVVSSMKLDENTSKRIRPAIMAARKACVKRTSDGLFDGVDDAALVKFRADYPLSDEDRAHLKQAIFADGRTQLALHDDGQGNLTPQRVPATSSQPVSMRGTGAGGTPQRGQGGRLNERVKLVEGSSGVNPTERAVSYLCSKNEAFKKLDQGDQVFRAGRFLRGEIEEAQAAH